MHINPDDAQPRFHQALDELDDRFTAAGLRIVESMPRFIAGFLAGREELVDECRTVTEDVASECEDIENTGFLLLARNQPVGRDLRRMVALLRMCVNVDRSAALLRHVGESLCLTESLTLPAPLDAQVQELGDRAAEVFRGGMEAWRTKDALAVNDVDRADEDVDRLQALVLETAASNDAAADARIVLGLVARYLERIADHGVAIARDTAFVGTGERVELPSKSG